jgi:uncharacterized protein involved in outer membrane biogenesis
MLNVRSSKIRKAVVGLGVFFAVVLAVLVILPIAFRGRIAALARTELERRVDARVDWSGIGLSLLRNFPNATLRLKDLTIAGAGRFQNDTLASVRHFRLVLDLGSVLGAVRKGEQIVVRAVELNEPAFYLHVLPDGTANWQITKTPADTTTAGERGRPFNIMLRNFELRDAHIVLHNEASRLFVSMQGLDQSLTGDFTRERFVVDARTHADTLTVRFGGVPYLDRVRLDARAAVDADMVQRKFSLRDNEIRLNELQLGFSGSVAQTAEQIALDLELNAQRTEFRHILSLVPAVYQHDFASLQTAGGVSVTGRITGAYGENAFPAFALHARVDSAQFRYPDLPLPARNIFADLSIENPGRDADNTVVNLKRFQAVIGNEPITASMVLRTPVSDPEIDARVNGNVDLAAANQTLKLEGIQELSGVVAANVTVRTKLSYLDSARYERVSARGTASVRNLRLRTAKLRHALAIDDAQLQLTPARSELTSFRGRIGSSDVQLSGSIDNVLGFVLRDEDLRGRATLASRHFELDEWQSDAARRIIPVPARIDFTLAATIDELKHDRLSIRNARGTVQLKDERLTLTDFRFNTLGGEIAMSGYYDTVDPTRPSFDMKLGMRQLDIPRAFEQFVTVQRLAPVARYTQGSFSADLSFTGALGDDLTPLFDVLTGQGTVLASRVALRDFPALDRLADVLKLQQLKDPALDSIASSIDIRGGRLHVRPFQVRLGDSRMTVTGSNGVDQSLQYTLGLEVPRAALGAEADRVVASLIAQAGRTGVQLQPSDVVQLGVQLTGTVRDPSIKTDFSGVASSARAGLGRAVAGELERRAEATEERVDEAKEAARRKAEAEAARIVQEAEQRAAAVREEAAKLAETVRREGHERADSLLARATNPVARTAARPVADRLRKEADEKADQIVREADERAEAIVAEARKKADALRGG